LRDLRAEWLGEFERGGWTAADLSPKEALVWFGLLKSTGVHGLASAFLDDLGGPMRLNVYAIRACIKSLIRKRMLRLVSPEERYAPAVFRLATRPGRYVTGRPSRGGGRGSNGPG
jgi:hypothetical protein